MHVLPAATCSASYFNVVMALPVRSIAKLAFTLFFNSNETSLIDQETFEIFRRLRILLFSTPRKAVVLKL
jgi:hypothetical protein